MITLRHILPIIFLITMGFFTACEKNEIPEPLRSEESIDIYLRGDIREPEQSEFSPFSVSIGWFNDDSGYLFWRGGDATSDELGPTMKMGIYGFDPGRPFFGLQFWPDLPEERELSEEEVKAMFAPGTTFPFGKGIGKVDFSLRLPIGGPFAQLEASKSTFLNDPSGALTILSMEDYSFQEYSGVRPVTVKGKLLTATIEGQVGRYNSFDDQADGMPGFITNEVVEIANGEVIFYVEYQE